MNKKTIQTLLTLFIISAFSPANAAEDKFTVNKPENPATRPTLVRALMCEDMLGSDPQNVAVVFSVSLGKVISFTDFDPVVEKTFVHHNWYFREQKRASVKLTLNPPRWATFSTIQMRETDKGPWRVEITDLEGNILKILRFSIAD